MGQASSISTVLVGENLCVNAWFSGHLATELPYNCAVLVLSLDTSSPTGSIAVLREDCLIGVISTHTDETYSSRIFRQLEFLLAELRLKLDAFDLFAVNAGPGSFTGLRVGLTTAKAWADAFSRPVVPVSGLEAVATQTSEGAEHIVSVVDARRGQLYVGSYKRTLTQSSHQPVLIRAVQDSVMSPEEFLGWLEAPEQTEGIVVTPSQSLLESVLYNCNRSEHPIRKVSPVLAPSIGVLACSKAREGESVDALTLDANYVRRSDAELNWKGK
ncbi:MAG: tRNA (adenosine(37)-N6)-threonylcarbamoyltransferase complex dimerization subunit type 1 TsaB [Candidatus Acidiferrales bacterium]